MAREHTEPAENETQAADPATEVGRPDGSDAASSRAEEPRAEVSRAEGEQAPEGVSRRGMLGTLLAGGATLALGAAGGFAAGTATANASSNAAASREYPFFGEHQQGVTTPVQDRMHFAAFDLRKTATRESIIELLQAWSYAAARLTQGLDVSASGAVGGSEFAPPDDTGEALGLSAAGLTITFGFGPSLFKDEVGRDRFGLASKQPAELQPLPPFSGDALKAELTGGDLCIQACADDPQVAVHAIRNLTRIAVGTATLRWSQLGFGRTSSTSVSQVTERNLFGFKDGTANVKAEETAEVTEHVWVGDEAPEWMRGGTYLVARRIRMLIEPWDRQSLGEQERIIGRTKGEGAAIGHEGEFDDFDPNATDAAGAPILDVASHVRLAHPANNGGARIMRRGYNFVDGNDELGRLNAGLFFITMQRDPEQFIRVQRSLQTDLLNEYIRHEGGGIWAVPPGAREGGYVGEGLFAG